MDIGQAVPGCSFWINIRSALNWSLCNKRESAALLNASCDKTSDFTVEDLSPAGRWLYEMLTGTDVPEPETEPLGSDPSAEKSQLSTNAYTCTTEIVNQWESNGDHYYQYQLTLTNTSDTELSGWEIDLPFSGILLYPMDGMEITPSWIARLSTSFQKITMPLSHQEPL